MVEYITRDEIRGNAGPLTEQASIVRKAEARSPTGSSFLSHSTKDADLLPGVIAILERHGAAVYVDKKDESLPPTTSRETASILKNRIKQCRKFILLTTKNSKDSRWMPWELGLLPTVTAKRPTLPFSPAWTAPATVPGLSVSIWESTIVSCSASIRTTRGRSSWSGIKKKIQGRNCRPGYGTESRARFSHMAYLDANAMPKVSALR